MPGVPNWISLPSHPVTEAPGVHLKARAAVASSLQRTRQFFASGCRCGRENRRPAVRQAGQWIDLEMISDSDQSGGSRNEGSAGGVSAVY